jgi:hypothetical protein
MVSLQVWARWRAYHLLDRLRSRGALPTSRILDDCWSTRSNNSGDSEEIDSCVESGISSNELLDPEGLSEPYDAKAVSDIPTGASEIAGMPIVRVDTDEEIEEALAASESSSTEAAEGVGA